MDGAHLKTGGRGEDVAAGYLRERGWTILARNYRLGRREVDMVARRGGVVAFVEVKTRRGDGFGHPLEAITWRKRREIAAVAAAWLADTDPHPGEVRFDAVAVWLRADGGVEVEHVPDAWRPGSGGCG